MIKISSIYTDDLSGLAPQTDLICSIGEYKTLEAQYKCESCLVLDNSVIRYNPAWGLESIEYPKNDNNWKITCVGLVVGVYYPMTLEVNNQSTGLNYFNARNFNVWFRKDNATEFTIKHDFYITDDVNGYIGDFGNNDYGKWLQQRGIDNNNTTQGNIIGTTLFDTNKYFTRYVEVMDIKTSEKDFLLDYDLIQARFYEGNISNYITDTWVFPTNPLTKYAITPISITFNQLNTFVPTSAKILLINTEANNGIDFKTSIIDDEVLATISGTAPNYTLSANIQSYKLANKELVAIVYYGLDNVVISAKSTIPISTIIGCYPTIEPRYDDYNMNFIGSCIESTPLERIGYGFRISRTLFNNDDPFFTGTCFPDGFDTLPKSVVIKVFKQSTMDLIFEGHISWVGGTWVIIYESINGALLLNTTTLWYQFRVLLRNERDYLGEYMLATFDLNISYGTTIETVQSQSLNYVLNYDNALATPIISSIELIDPSTNNVISSMIGNIMTLNPSCLDYFKVKICKSDPAEYNVIAVLRQALVYEEESYPSTLMTQINQPYFTSVPVDFGGNSCAEFFLDTSTLDKSLSWELAVIIKKV